MYDIRYSNRIKRDIKKMKRRGKDLSKLSDVLNLLASGNPLPARYRDHMLTENFAGMRECHIEPDWLLIYQIFEDTLVLLATATGSHADLFRM